MARVKDAKGRIDQNVTADRVTTVKNFINSAGGHSHSEVWQEIKTLTWNGKPAPSRFLHKQLDVTS